MTHVTGHMSCHIGVSPGYTCCLIELQDLMQQCIAVRHTICEFVQIPVKIPPGMSTEQAQGVVDFLKSNPQAAKAAWDQAQGMLKTPGFANAMVNMQVSTGSTATDANNVDQLWSSTQVLLSWLTTSSASNHFLQCAANEKLAYCTWALNERLILKQFRSKLSDIKFVQ